MSDASWKKCTTCKKPIAFKTTYWVCNVTTCNRKRTGLTFCSVDCWDAHVPVLRHKDSWAEERRSPSAEEWERTLSGEDEAPRTRTRRTEAQPPEQASSVAAAPPSAPVVIRRRPG